MIWQAMAFRGFSSHEITRQILMLGVQPGGVLLVHAAFSKVAPMEGGPRGLIEALLTALGPTGTLAMPSMTDHGDHPFDPKETPVGGIGVVAETFWRIEGVMRSASLHAFTGLGPAATEITAPHPVDVPHRLDSPVGRVYALAGQVLLLRVGHEANTTVHLAEPMAGVRYRRSKSPTLLRAGQPTRYHYDSV